MKHVLLCAYSTFEVYTEEGDAIDLWENNTIVATRSFKKLQGQFFCLFKTAGCC